MVKDAGTLLAGDVVDRGLGLAFLLVATKLFGLEIYGAYQLALAVFQVVRTIVSFGLGRSLVKDTAAASAVDDTGRVKGSILLGLVISVSLAFVLGSAVFFGAVPFVSTFYPTHPEVIAPLRIFGLLTPFFAVNFILLQAFYGLGRIRLMVATNNVVEPVARLSALVLLFAAGMSGAYALPTSYLVALGVSSLFAIVAFRLRLWSRFASAKATYRVRETLAFTVPVTLNDLATRSFRSVNIFLLAPLLTAEQLGIFSVALKFTSVVMFFSGSLTAAFRPRIARLVAKQRFDVLAAETRAYNRWILTFALLPYGLLILFPEAMLTVLGSQYEAVAPSMRIFCAGLLVAQAAGPLMALLMMSGRSRAPLVFMIAGSLFYGVLAYLFVPRYDVVGAAAAAAIAIVTLIPILSIYVQRALKIRIYGASMWKPLAAGAVAFLAAFGVSLIVPDIRVLNAMLIGGTATGIYLTVLWFLGAEPEEKALLEELLGPIAKIRRKLKKLFG